MAAYKCKMCGGSLEVGEGSVTGTCEYCGTEQTLPRLDTQERQSLFDRAGHFRRNNDYDKALALYERILETDSTDPEAYWSLLLCKYGIEYVDDPKSKKRTITCNRTLRKSILVDADYEAVLAYATEYARRIYEKEAKEIDRIQKAALSIIDGQEPFDIFICFKQTDSAGRPTKDSRRAQDIYDALSKEGFKVFFSKITLEDKLGIEYEPYIFAALASAKVMVVVGTSKENLESVWVRNEWSRFLTMAASDPTKKLIPAYEDMDPYDMPVEFAMLQALSMDSFTFVQDLVRGVKKLLDAAGGAAGVSMPAQGVAPTMTVVASAHDPLVKRARLMCEDGDFNKANELIEQALNLNPENGEAYLVAFMAEMKCRQEEALGHLVSDGLAHSSNYQKALRFGDAVLKERLKAYDEQSKVNLSEKKRKEEEKLALIRKAESFLNSDHDDSKQAINELTIQLQQLQSNISSLASQAQQFEYQRSQLGIFAREEKKQIDAQLNELSQKRSSIASQITGIERRIEEYRSGALKKSQVTWKVLDVVNNCALAISKDCIAKMPYHQPGGSITWEFCTLRKWLNTEFYNSLPAEVRARVVEVVNNNPNSYNNTPGGNDTRDKVFLLSVEQAKSLFKNDSERIAKYDGTDYWWWLRSPGDDPYHAACVNRDGSLYEGGNYVGRGNYGVRPVLWLNL